ncbi:hypothetical protein KI440_01895 [Candidatus Saccharibacteria bacterium TM7i]|nr:hypothetical protein KI440_01895 [Candidatus Saccharibacteria bacterium TM7i]
MATTKKPAAKKTTSKASTARKAPVKKTVAAKSTAKKPVAKRTANSTARKAPTTRKVAAKKTAKMRSFHVAGDQPPFKSFAITRQTVYWLILVSVIIFAQLWILKTQYEVINLLDQQLIDAAL